MHMRVFSTKVVSLHRASNTELINHKNSWWKPLLKKLYDETPKKLEAIRDLILAYFPILLVKT